MVIDLWCVFMIKQVSLFFIPSHSYFSFVYCCPFLLQLPHPLLHAHLLHSAAVLLKGAGCIVTLLMAPRIPHHHTFTNTPTRSGRIEIRTEPSETAG